MFFALLNAIFNWNILQRIRNAYNLLKKSKEFYFLRHLLFIFRFLDKHFTSVQFIYTNANNILLHV